MKTLAIYKRYLLGIFLTLCLSCQKLVEVDDPINQLSTQQVFSSKATAESALNALYIEMQQSSLLSGGTLGAGALLGSYTDELNGYNINSLNATMDLYNNVQTPSNTTVRGVWTNAYKEIYMANAIIQGLDNAVSIAPNDARRIKGETLVLRSIVYFYLTQIFGDIPLTTSTDYAFNRSLSKTAGEEVLNTISLDLEAAIPMLEDSYRNSERIFVNRKTAELFLSLVYISQGKWPKAETMLTAIVQSPLYTWEADISKTFKKDSRNILFQLKPLFSGNATPEAMLYYFYSNVPNEYAASSSLIASFGPQDLRLQQWFAVMGNGSQTYHKINKYKVISQNTDEYSVVFRLEEAYLLLAELFAEQDKIQQSLEFLNPVRLKAGLLELPSTVSLDDLKAEILQETRREFFTERGIRLLSLKRAAKLSSLASVKPNWKAFHAQWPLPLTELLLNPNLKPQNDGY